MLKKFLLAIISLMLVLTSSFVPSYFNISEPSVLVGPLPDADYEDLQSAIDSVEDGYTIYLQAGTFIANPMDFEDPQCGNCQDPSTIAKATTGFRIIGKSLRIIGTGMDSTILVTNAGYGIYIEDCPRVTISNLTITGGIRDQDGNATDAAIVVRRSNVEVGYCEIRDNQGDFEKTIAGVGGIMGREGAILNIHHNLIHDNSWDGIALYRGATAQISDNEIWNGRGAGIGITWDAHATIIRNDIHDYWKGIGAFGNSRVGVFNNFVHDLVGWGIISSGTADMVCRNNTVINCGNVGIAGWDTSCRLEIVNNIVAMNGNREMWVAPRVGIWMNCQEGNYKIAHNDIFGNHDANVAFGYKLLDDSKWTFEEERFFAGIDGNISSDPGLIDGFRISDGSSCKDAGDPAILDIDGTRSDIGATGGPHGL